MINTNAKKAFSISRLFYRYFFIMLICTSGVLLFFCLMSFKSSSEQLRYNTDTIINSYKYELESEMDSALIFEQKMCFTDAALNMLTISNHTASDRLYYLYNVKQALTRQVAPYECIFVFNEDNSVSTHAYGSSFSMDGTQYIFQLKRNIKDFMFSENAPAINTWLFYEDEHYSVLLAANKIKDIYICTVIDLDGFNVSNYNPIASDYMQFGFYNASKIITNQDALSNSGITLDNLPQHKTHSFFLNHYLKTIDIANTDISMFCIFYTNSLWLLTKVTMVIFIVIAMISCIILACNFYSFNKLLLYPLNLINTATEHLEQDNFSEFMKNNNTNIIEYQNINHALANLVNQKISLNNEKELEALQKDHARLQYYQLQTSSHFFVNCLKSLYNMLENNEYEKMQRMIIAFSNHLRYVFHDNLKVVPLESELAEVNDYYNIILLDRNTPIILDTNVDEHLLKYHVPSLIIQTFLENTAKYNKQTNKLLIFDVKITQEIFDDTPIMQIQISDNGIGYSPEILERLNNFEDDLFAKKHVGISNLKHRIQLIYKTNYKFAFYNKPGGGACALIYLPLLTIPQK